MSKRFMLPQQNGDRKKARLDISISDHNFPLSQNQGPSKESKDADTWGDDNDDEILLLASQACEEAYNNDISQLPDYSLCMQPPTTSTQYDPGPSTSKGSFSFKKPTSTPSNMVSTNLKDKCSRISSPLPGISSKINSVAPMNHDDVMFSDKVCNGDADYVYKQLLQLQEENSKLKCENGKLLEKCVTKEGEASILRTQLKSCQSLVDSARLERVRAQEKTQLEWSGKMAAANQQLHELRTQLDFKNLEIISIKEKCRMLESNKIKLTQVTVASHDISARNTSITEAASPLAKRIKTQSNATQTDNKSHFIVLSKRCSQAPSPLEPILPSLLPPTAPLPSLLEYSEKLQSHSELSQHKCRIYNTFHRGPNTASRVKRCGVTLASVYGDIVGIARNEDNSWEMFFRVLKATKNVLKDVLEDLKTISQKSSTAFQKEIDEKYIDCTTSYQVVRERDLLTAQALFKEEQAILARRLLATFSYILSSTNFDLNTFKAVDQRKETLPSIIYIISQICTLLESTSCAIYYSGLLLSITSTLPRLKQFIQTDQQQTATDEITVDIIKNLISCRPLLPVAVNLLQMVVNEGRWIFDKLCVKTAVGNLKMDYDQGVILYKKDSCHVQILLKQIEAALKCIETQHLRDEAERTAQSLVGFYERFSYSNGLNQEKIKCDCQLILPQVLIYSLRICSAMIINSENIPNDRLLAICRSGTLIIYRSVLTDVEFGSQLGYNEGHLIEFCEVMKRLDRNEVYSNMLSEISGTFQSSPEDTTASFSKQPWLSSFESFAITD